MTMRVRAAPLPWDSWISRTLLFSTLNPAVTMAVGQK